MLTYRIKVRNEKCKKLAKCTVSYFALFRAMYCVPTYYRTFGLIALRLTKSCSIQYAFDSVRIWSRGLYSKKRSVQTGQKTTVPKAKDRCRFDHQATQNSVLIFALQCLGLGFPVWTPSFLQYRYAYLVHCVAVDHRSLSHIVALGSLTMNSCLVVNG